MHENLTFFIQSGGPIPFRKIRLLLVYLSVNLNYHVIFDKISAAFRIGLQHARNDSGEIKSTIVKYAPEDQYKM